MKLPFGAGYVRLVFFNIDLEAADALAFGLGGRVARLALVVLGALRGYEEALALVNSAALSWQIN